MANPPGMTPRHFQLDSGDKIHVFYNAEQIIVQFRRNVPTKDDPLATSVKTATQLTPIEALEMAAVLAKAAETGIARQVRDLKGAG